jgi:hypothetical protein
MLRAGRWCRAALAVLLAVAAALLGACGDEGQGRPISAGRASELRSTLSQIQQSVTDGDCAAATAQAQTLEQQAGDLPRGVDSDLRRALRGSSRRLTTLVEQKCGATGSSGPTGPAEPAQSTTGATGATGGEGKKNGKQKEKKPKKDKGKSEGQQPVEPPPGETTPPDTGGAGGNSGGDGGGFVP